MLGAKKVNPDFNATKVLDVIEKAVYEVVKPYGFKKHGRTLHRFVSDDISQVINFQGGQAYLGETHRFGVNIGIRVPECAQRSFSPEQTMKKYYHEYECNMRSKLRDGKRFMWYDMRKSSEEIIADIVLRLQRSVIPAFEVLNSRDAILACRRNYPHLDEDRALILLEEAMIYGRRGEVEKATELFSRYYHEQETDIFAEKYPDAAQRHLRYLDELAGKLGIEVK